MANVAFFSQDAHCKFCVFPPFIFQEKPTFLVMHGGSGSTEEEIRTAVSNGAIKMNVDTDTQWAYWDGLRGFYEKNKGYLQGQVKLNVVEIILGFGSVSRFL